MFFDCPICKGALTLLPTGVRRCPKGHSFDRARWGYYNLLPPRGGSHGDNREMVEARRAFLDGGHYAPLADAVSRRVAECMSGGGVLLDAGCGEGYYTASAERALAETLGSERPYTVLGFDISKDAVRYAAKRSENLGLAVASSYSMPLGDSSVDVVMNVFSPLAIDETRRVLKTGGYFVFVFPGEEHLFSLKKRIYDTPYKNRPDSTEIEGFDLLSLDKVDYTLTLDGAEDVKNLFMMTPYAYRTSAEGRERVLSSSTLVTEVSFRVLVYKKA